MWIKVGIKESTLITRNSQGIMIRISVGIKGRSEISKMLGSVAGWGVGANHGSNMTHKLECLG